MSKRFKTDEEYIDQANEYLGQPRNVFYQILAYVNPEDIIAMCRVSWKFNDLCNRDGFWDKVFIAKYGRDKYNELKEMFPNIRKLYLAYTAVINNEHRINMLSQENVHIKIEYRFVGRTYWGINVCSKDRHKLLEETNTIILILEKLYDPDEYRFRGYFALYAALPVLKSIDESVFKTKFKEYVDIGTDVKYNSIAIGGMSNFDVTPDKLLQLVYEMTLNGFLLQTDANSNRYLSCAICEEIPKHTCSTCNKQFCSVECSIKSKC